MRLKEWETTKLQNFQLFPQKLHCEEDHQLADGCCSSHPGWLQRHRNRDMMSWQRQCVCACLCSSYMCVCVCDLFPVVLTQYLRGSRTLRDTLTPSYRRVTSWVPATHTHTHTESKLNVWGTAAKRRLLHVFTAESTGQTKVSSHWAPVCECFSKESCVCQSCKLKKKKKKSCVCLFISWEKPKLNPANVSLCW